jgi:hypothetical protein
MHYLVKRARHMTNFLNPDDPVEGLGTLVGFWRWALSDLIGNTNRGLLAEYLVGRLLGLSLDTPRLEWDCADLLYHGRRIEVKASAYRQTWHHAESSDSKISFGVAPHRCWDAPSNTYGSEMRRWADVYVFCLLMPRGTVASREALVLDNWRFYVCSTVRLEQQIPLTQKTAALSTIERICGAGVDFRGLKVAVDAALEIKE